MTSEFVREHGPRAVSGPRRGERLERVAHDQQLWFALAASLTGDVRIVGGEGTG